MSLVEQALDKARAEHQKRGAIAAQVAPIAAASSPLIADRAPAQRKSTSPDITISEEMWKALGHRTESVQNHQQQSEFRHMKRRILNDVAASSHSNSRVLVVASALAGEGKTFTAANLAISLAREPDYSVLLVDADVISPSLSSLFGLHDQQGLLDTTLDSAVDVESLIRTTDVEGLSVLPAGRRNPDATEAFASKRMLEIMEQLLKTPNRLIVADTLPLLLTTESRALMPLAGQILLVVRADSTPKSAVIQALELIQDQEERIKVVLNAVERSRLGGYGGYYGYGYDYKYGPLEP